MNERLIKMAHLVAVAALLLGTGFAVARQSGSAASQDTNQNSGQQNQNTNQRANNANGNTNTNAGRNVNANTNLNANTEDSMNSNMGHNTNSQAGNTNQSGNTNSSAGGQGETTGQGVALGSSDRKFVTEAALSGMAEVELGRLAVERGASAAVKQFGQRMVDDHTRANEELMRLASGLGITVPALDAKHRAPISKLSRLSGAEFDRAYMKQMVTDHQKAVSLFQREAERGAHADLKSFAAGKLPALQEHLRMAREMAGDGRGGRTTSATNMNR